MPEDKKPVVSVVMSVYNGARYLHETIESVMSQTGIEFEFLIVDDGSSDPRVRELLQDYASKDGRIKPLYQDNQGLTRALSRACVKARGCYLARIDVGDVMAAGRLVAQAQVMEAYPQCSLVSCATSFHGPEWEFMWTTQGSPLSDEPVTVTIDGAGTGLSADVAHHGAVMMRKSTYEQVGGYRPEFYYGQDWDLWYRLAEAGDFLALREVLYRARFFPEAISMTQADKQRRMAVLSKRAHCLRKRGESDEMVLDEASSVRPGVDRPTVVKRQYAGGYYFVGEALRRSGHRACRSYLLKSIKARPLSPRSWLRLLQASLLR